MDISIIIISWNVKELLKKCLQSIYDKTQGLEFEVFVVDNASKDGSALMVASKFTRVNLIASNENMGFAKANNLALEHAQGKYVLFLNPDTELTDNSLKVMFDLMEQDEKIALSTCQLIYPDSTLQKNIKNNPGLCDQILILLKLHHLFLSKCLNRYLAKNFIYEKEQEVKQIMGAFMFARAEVIKEIGGFDPDYFIWWEDLDLCKRIQDLGQKIIYTPKTKVIHHEAKSFEQQMSLEKQKRFNRGMAIYFRKHTGLFSYLVIKLLSCFSLGLAWFSQIFKIKSKTQSKI
ncbi:MAG: glycosyltransferase family 2 protein [Candidatus Parcubacteria bacterium]|nr:glycosyltransferase family 2 protein [Candidatus Parcubacteria bacterium]